jgi:starch phosphorylase
MVRDYVETLYEPSAAQSTAMRADNFGRARALATWKAGVREKWDDVAVVNVEGEVTAADLGDQRDVAATVRVGNLSTDDISVELAHGLVGANGELMDPSFMEMSAESCEAGTCVYRGSFAAEATGLYGFAVRAIPAHEDLTTKMDLGLIAWA